MFAIHQLVWYQIFCCVGRKSKIRGLVISFFFSSSLVTQPLNFFYHEDAVVQTNDTKPPEMNTWRQRKQHMPPSLPVEGMEKVFLCDNEERNTRFISGSPACQSHHIPKTVRGCISPNRLVSNIGESILHVQLQLVDFHGRQNINIRKYSFLKKKVRLECKQCDYWHLNYFMSEIFSQRE